MKKVNKFLFVVLIILTSCFFRNAIKIQEEDYDWTKSYGWFQDDVIVIEGDSVVLYCQEYNQQIRKSEKFKYFINPENGDIANKIKIGTSSYSRYLNMNYREKTEDGMVVGMNGYGQFFIKELIRDFHMVERNPFDKDYFCITYINGDKKWIFEIENYFIVEEFIPYGSHYLIILGSNKDEGNTISKLDLMKLFVKHGVNFDEAR